MLCYYILIATNCSQSTTKYPAAHAQETKSPSCNSPDYVDNAGQGHERSFPVMDTTYLAIIFLQKLSLLQAVKDNPVCSTLPSVLFRNIRKTGVSIGQERPH